MKNKHGIMEEALRRDDSFNAIRDKVDAALSMAIRSGQDMDCDGDGTQDCNDYAWIQDLYPSIVVYSMNGFLFQCDYTINDSQVTLGTPKRVGQTYTPVGESQRVLVANVESLKESAYNAAAGEFPVKIIQPGMSKNNRFYPAEVLKRDFAIFEGAKMFADHQTEAEAKQKPEGSVNNWVATLQGVYAESDGTLRGRAVVIDPNFKSKLATLAEKGLLTEMGISIRAVGAGTKKTIENVEATYVESLIACRSVDFVTFAGAGGQVLYESATTEFDLDLVNEAQLRTRRPDLVALIESTKEKTMQKTLEQQLQEARQQIATLETKLTTTEGKLQEAEKAQRRQAAATELEGLLKESKLPEPAKNRIKQQFKEAEKVEGMKEAIQAEEDYIKSIVPAGAVAPRKNLGAADNATQESAGNGQEANLEEAFKLLLPESEAKLAAQKK